MIRLDLGYFLRFSSQLARMRFMPSQTIGQVRPPLQEARAWIHSFGQEQMFGSVGFRTAKHQATALMAVIDRFLGQDDTAQVAWEEEVALITALNNFETALLSEASMADAYYVLEKEPYSTLALVTKGESLFPPSLVKKVPEAVTDMREAGKCLAYEIPTAAAFHIHRATEAVLRRYWSVVAATQAKPKQRNIGVYLAAMKRLKCGDEKVIAALTQMKDLHRNPIIHPDDSLDLQEALALAGIANSVVAAMLKQIPDVKLDQPEIPGLGGALATYLKAVDNDTGEAA